MAEQPKKPRNIKDLKARLGRTASTGSGAPDPLPAPHVGTSSPSGGIVPPSGAPQVPGVLPPPGIGVPPHTVGGSIPGLPGGQQIAPPPFMQSASEQEQRPARAVDPFAATPAPDQQGPREVRIVLDESAVDEAEIGRQKRSKNFLLLGFGTALGLLFGATLGSVNADRRLYNQAVIDGTSIYREVQTASETVEQASDLLDRAAIAARGAAGEAPAVDFEAIEALQSMERPFAANTFSRRRYRAFETSSVDQLFDYYNKINQLWSRFEALGTMTVGEQRRATLTAAAEAVGTMASQQTGCVPIVDDQGFFCGLVFVSPIRRDEQSARQPPSNLPMVQVTDSIRSRRPVEKTLFRGGELGENPSDFVILTQTQRSVGVLGQQASLFAEYQSDVLATKRLMSATTEVQGSLEQSLGKIAALQLQWSIPMDTKPRTSGE